MACIAQHRSCSRRVDRSRACSLAAVLGDVRRFSCAGSHRSYPNPKLIYCHDDASRGIGTPAAPRPCGVWIQLSLCRSTAPRVVACWSSIPENKPSSKEPEGSGLSNQDLRTIHEEWAAFWGVVGPADRNRLLAQRMSELTEGDPWALDIAKQDGKEYVTGMIGAAELRDRFVSIFSVAGRQMCEALFKEMAMLVPAPRRPQLLELCPDPFVLPYDRKLPAAAGEIQQPAEEAEEEYEDEDESEDDGMGYALEQEEDYEGEEDVKEFRGWQVLDRSRIMDMAQQMVDEGAAPDPAAAAAAQAAGAEGSASGTGVAREGVIEPLAAAGLSEDSLSSRPANSRKARGKKSQLGSKGKAAASSACGAQLPSPDAPRNVVVWLRADLRLHDNPALVAATKAARQLGGTVTLLYVHSPEEDGTSAHESSTYPPEVARARVRGTDTDTPQEADGGQPAALPTSWRPGGASRLWLHLALASLDEELQSKYGAGASIVLRRGPYADALRDVADSVAVAHMYYNRRYEPASMACDTAVCQALEACGIQVHAACTSVLREPWEVRVDMASSTWRGHFGSLGPFSAAHEKLGPLAKPLPAPKALPVLDDSLRGACASLALGDLGLFQASAGHDTTSGEQSSTLRDAWHVSEAEALRRMDTVVERGASGQGPAGSSARQEQARSQALSPYLRWGQLSPRLLFHKMNEAGMAEQCKALAGRLVARDLAYWQLYHWPRMHVVPIRTAYADHAWVCGQDMRARLDAWQRGATGFPYVDAAMRELLATGWMDAHMRAAAACLLTEYFNVNWVAGAAWFHENLVDADTAVNAMMWQNAGKSGLDQWARTASPDATGSADDAGRHHDYVRHWVPELALLPDVHLLAPWGCSASELAAAGVTLGVTYPQRVTGDVGLAQLREGSADAVRAARAAHAGKWVDRRGNDLVVAPKGSTTTLDGRKVAVFTAPEFRTVDPAPSS